MYIGGCTQILMIRLHSQLLCRFLIARDMLPIADFLRAQILNSPWLMRPDQIGLEIDRSVQARVAIVPSLRVTVSPATAPIVVSTVPSAATSVVASAIASTVVVSTTVVSTVRSARASVTAASTAASTVA